MSNNKKDLKIGLNNEMKGMINDINHNRKNISCILCGYQPVFNIHRVKMEYIKNNNWRIFVYGEDGFGYKVLGTKRFDNLGGVRYFLRSVIKDYV